MQGDLHTGCCRAIAAIVAFGVAQGCAASKTRNYIDDHDGSAGSAGAGTAGAAGNGGHAGSLGAAGSSTTDASFDGRGGGSFEGGLTDAGCFTSCAAAGKNCGIISDGCSGTLDCGKCVAPLTCGGSGVENVCGCVKTTCAAEGKNCGSIV